MRLPQGEEQRTRAAFYPQGFITGQVTLRVTVARTDDSPESSGLCNGRLGSGHFQKCVATPASPFLHRQHHPPNVPYLAVHQLLFPEMCGTQAVTAVPSASPFPFASSSRDPIASGYLRLYFRVNIHLPIIKCNFYYVFCIWQLWGNVSFVNLVQRKFQFGFIKCLKVKQKSLWVLWGEEFSLWDQGQRPGSARLAPALRLAHTHGSPNTEQSKKRLFISSATKANLKGKIFSVY